MLTKIKMGVEIRNINVYVCVCACTRVQINNINPKFMKSTHCLLVIKVHPQNVFQQGNYHCGFLFCIELSALTL